MSIYTIMAASAVLLAGTTGTSLGEDESIGAAEYKVNCALCHGISGKGDGHFAEFLVKKPSDLTLLSKNNGGVFPLDEVHMIIDGREMPKGHGTREMPVWGDRYTVEGVKRFGPYFSEFYVQAIILALISHLYSLQE